MRGRNGLTEIIGGSVDAKVAPPDEMVEMVIVTRNAALLALSGGAAAKLVAANRAARRSRCISGEKSYIRRGLNAGE